MGKNYSLTTSQLLFKATIDRDKTAKDMQLSRQILYGFRIKWN
jgi:hypothetical protein